MMAARLRAKEAAVLLGVSTDWLYVLAARGDLGPVTNSGDRGRGKRLFFDAAEVEAFARGGAPAAKAYRESRQAVAPKRGRKVKV